MISAQDLRLDDFRQDRRIARWLALLGVTDARVPRENAKTALRFVAERLPATPVGDALSFLMAMDLSKVVNVVELTVGTRLIGFREAEALKKGDTTTDLRAKFFAFPGASPHRLGIRVGSRQVVHYNVHTAGWALSSYASGALDYWTDDSPGDTATWKIAELSLGATGMHPTFSSIKLNTTGVHATGGDRQLLVPQAWRYVKIVPPELTQSPK